MSNYINRFLDSIPLNQSISQMQATIVGNLLACGWQQVATSDGATTGGIATLAAAPTLGSTLYGVSQVKRDLGTAIADATDASSVITQLNLLLAEMRRQGKIAT